MTPSSCPDVSIRGDDGKGDDSPSKQHRGRLMAIVHGHVQGVSFRYYTRQRARGLGLVGYVRNCQDGTVEIVAEGPESSLWRLHAWLHHGPSLARVLRVDSHWDAPQGEFRSFGVRY